MVISCIDCQWQNLRERRTHSWTKICLLKAEKNTEHFLLWKPTGKTYGKVKRKKHTAHKIKKNLQDLRGLLNKVEGQVCLKINFNNQPTNELLLPCLLKRTVRKV